MNPTTISNPITSKYEAFGAKITNATVKTLIVDLSRKFGGASSRVLTLMQNFPPGQASLAVLENSPIAREAHRLGLPFVIVGKYKTSPLIFFRLVSAVRRNGYQVLDTQNPQSKFWGSLVAWVTGISLVSTLNSWYMDEHGKRSVKGFLYSLLEFGTNFSLSRYIVVSQSIFDALGQYGIEPSRISLIYNAVDIDPSNVLSLKPSLVEKYNIPPDSVVITTAGRFVWAKGYDDLVSAFRLIADNEPDVYCLIAGDGELYLDIKKKIESAGLEKRIILLGHIARDEVLSLIKACDIFVMSSRSEGTPVVLLEAAGLKKPIVSTDVGGISELLKNEDECLLVSPDDLNALANGINRILSEKELSKRLAQAAHLRVSRDFSVEKQVQDTISVYYRVRQDRKLI